MTDISDPIDPKRPWIDDPEDAPAHMNWFSVFFVPTGQTSRVHFLRATTLLFFVTAPFGIMMLMGQFLPAIYGVGLVSILSSIAHIRRLSSAQRSPLLAFWVLVPVLVSLGVFVAAASSAVPEANKIAERVEAKRAGEDITAIPGFDGTEQDQQTEDSEGEDQRGQGPRPGFDEDGHFSPLKFVLHKAGRPAGLAWALSAMLVLLWTLLWVGRLPNGGGTIQSRLEQGAPASP